MTDVDWFVVDCDIRRLIASNRDRLTPEDIDGVNHYLAVDEYEMALERLCLALMNLPDTPLSDLEALRELAKRLGLDEGSVFDEHFWSNFMAALNRRRARSS